jgi:hypothetical protein
MVSVVPTPAIGRVGDTFSLIGRNWRHVDIYYIQYMIFRLYVY